MGENDTSRHKPDDNHARLLRAAADLVRGKHLPPDGCMSDHAFDRLFESHKREGLAVRDACDALRERAEKAERERGDLRAQRDDTLAFMASMCGLEAVPDERGGFYFSDPDTGAVRVTNQWANETAPGKWRCGTRGPRCEVDSAGHALLLYFRQHVLGPAREVTDRYAEVRALADAYIDIVNRTARALGIPEVDEDGATPSLHDVPERVAEVVRERDKYLGGLVAIAAACAVSDESVAWNTMLRCDDIASMLLPKREEPTDDDATQDPPGWGVCGKVIPGSRRAEGPVRVERLCMDVPGHDGPCRFDARADGGEVGDGE